MKKCEKCGKDIESSAKFCPHCGSPQTAAESAAASQPKAEPVKKAPTPAPKPASGNGGGKKTLPIIAVAAIAVIALLVILLMPKNMEITPTDYVRVAVKGLDGEGRAELDFDTSSFISAIMAEKELKPAQQSEIEGLLQHAEDYFSFSSKEGLSNGDEVTISCSMPEKYLSDYKVKILDDSLKYSVAGLIEKQEINLKDYFVVDFYGFEGKGYVDYYLNENEIHKTLVEMVRNVDDSEEAENFIRDYAYSAIYDSYTSMSASQTEELSNGDKVTVSCPINTGYDRIAKYGIVFLSEDVEYTVEGLEAVETISVQDYIKAEFTGFDTDGNLRIIVDEEKVLADITEKYPEGRNGYTAEDVAYYVTDFIDYNFRLNADRYEDYSNGEAVQIFAEYDGYGEEPYVSSVGFMVEDATISTTVTGLEELLTLNACDYAKAVFTGYDGAGYLDVEVDQDALNADLQEMITDNRNGYTAEDAAYEIADYIYYYFNLYASKEEMLTNGESVQVSAEYDTDSDRVYISSLGIVLDQGQKNVTVENLETPQEADIMDALIVSFSGTTPRVTVNAEMNYDNPLNQFVNYDSYYNIPDRIVAHNGDTLDITLEYYADEALKNGYLITNNQRTYEISGLETYAYTLTDVNDERLQSLIENAKNEYYYFAMDKSDEIIKNTSGGGTVRWDLMTVNLDKIVRYNTDSANDYYNRTFLVYEIKFPVIYQSGASTSHTVYGTYYFNNAVEGVDGSLNIPEGKYSYFYYTPEALNEAFAEIPSSMGITEGYECVVEEFVNENKIEMVVEEAVETIAQPMELPAEEPVKAIPELPSDVAAQAAAMIEYDGHRYYRFDTPVTWEQAVNYCNNAGNAHIATITGKVENNVIRKLIDEGEMYGYWIGATDINIEGSWTWVTGEKFEFTSWDNSQPDNHSDIEHYAYISNKFNRNWNDDANEKENVGFILEVEADTEKNFEYLQETDLYLYATGFEANAWLYDTYGNCYYAPTRYDASEEGRTMYELNGAYSRFTGTTAVYEKAATDVNLNFAIFGDGELLYKQTGITRETKPTYFDIDVTGVELLTIKTSNWGGTSEDWLILGDAKVYASGTEMTDTKDRLLDLNIPKNHESNIAADLWRDAFGEWSDNRMYFDTRYGSYAYMNLNKEYGLFEGTFTVGTGTANRSYINVEVYGDDELLFSQEGISKLSGSVDFSIDVTGKQLLKIVTSEPNEQYDAYLYLTNGRLTKALAEEVPAEEVSAGAALALQKPVQITDEALANVSAKAEYGTHKYYLFESQITWDEAKAYCENAGGHLAVITGPQEQRRIEQLLKHSVAGEYWIGGIDLADEQWVWVTEEPMGYTYWKDGQPDNYNENENYLSLYDDGKWNDRPADAVLGFVMEISPDTPATYGKTKELAAISDRLLDSHNYEYWKTAYDYQNNKYISSYYMNVNNDPYAIYDLNGEFTSISGILSSSSESKAGADMDFAIFGDGVLLFDKKGMYGSQEALEFNADVTGVKTLTLRARCANDSTARLLLNDVILGVAETPTLNEKTTHLNELQIINNGGTDTHNRLFADTYGNVYDGDMCLEADNNESIVYLLGGNYTNFHCVIAARASTYMYADMNIAIYGDDKLLFSQDGITKATGPISVDLDVTGVGNLKIASTTNSDKYEEYLYIVDDQLR